MKAFFQTRYGAPALLQMADAAVPVPKKSEVRVQIHAVSLNGSDLEFLKGYPGYVRMWGPFRPPRRILGSDIAGVVDAVGSECTRFAAGDRVFGDILYTKGGLAEYVCAPEQDLIKVPDWLSFTDAAAIPQASTVALQAVRDNGKLQSGERVLINGAGGGAGTFALQLALKIGADVTVVDKAVKLPALLSLGAQRAIDYEQTDYTQGDQLYDLIIDFTCYRSMFHIRKALSPSGRYMVVGGALSRILQANLFGVFGSIGSKKRMGMLMHQQNETDILHMVSLHHSGQVSPVIAETYPLDETVQAFKAMNAGEKIGKFVIVP